MIDAEIEFLSVYNTFIRRDGAGAMLEWLKKSDFFDAPASSKFHGSYEGGLCEHSVNVYHRLRKLVDDYYPSLNKPSDETVAIVALLHDLCKVNYYSVEMRKRKDEYGRWEEYPTYTIEDTLCMGHGEGSLYRVQRFLTLSLEEAAAINWHMGYGDVRFRGGDNTVSKAFAKYPLALLLHTADSMATSFDES